VHAQTHNFLIIVYSSCGHKRSIHLRFDPSRLRRSGRSDGPPRRAGARPTGAHGRDGRHRRPDPAEAGTTMRLGLARRAVQSLPGAHCTQSAPCRARTHRARSERRVHPSPPLWIGRWRSRYHRDRTSSREHELFQLFHAFSSSSAMRSAPSTEAGEGDCGPHSVISSSAASPHSDPQ